MDSIVDWIDRDGDPKTEGAESNYYLQLSPPYFAKERSNRRHFRVTGGQGHYGAKCITVRNGRMAWASLIYSLRYRVAS